MGLRVVALAGVLALVGCGLFGGDLAPRTKIACPVPWPYMTLEQALAMRDAVADEPILGEWVVRFDNAEAAYEDACESLEDE